MSNIFVSASLFVSAYLQK